MNRIVGYSGKISFILFVLLTAVMAVATVVEKQNGTSYAYEWFYGSAWFIACWFTLVVYALIYIIAQKLYKRVLSICLHIALLLILVGALITHVSSQNGVIHLREGEHNHFFSNNNRAVNIIPFTLNLQSFSIEYYPGTNSPSDYVSKIEVNDPLNNNFFEAQISMNKILNYKGYRFYQSSFDDDMKGSIVSVNRDVYGIPVTYTGYYLLFVSMLLMLLDKNGRFRKLLRNPVLKKSVLAALLLMSAFDMATASPLLANGGETISREQAAKLGKLWVLHDERIMPLQSLAYDFTTKLYGKHSYKSYNAEQVMAGWLLFPEIWGMMPIFEIKNSELQDIVGGNNVSFSDLFTINGDIRHYRHYKLAHYYKQIYQGGKQSDFIKEAARLNEKIQIINMLQQGSLLAVFPQQQAGGYVQWHTTQSNMPDSLVCGEKLFMRTFFSSYQDAIIRGDEQKADELLNKLENYQQKNAGLSLPSNTHLQVEILYNKLDIFSLLFKINLTLGLLVLILFVWQTVNNTTNKTLSVIAYILLIVAFVVQTAGMGLRTYVSGRLPLGNGFETMLFVAWCALLIPVCLRRYSLIVPSFGLLISGFALLVAHLGAMNPKITNLVPVLSSPLLSLHVSVIMFSYALAAFMVMNSLTTFMLLIFGNKKNISNLLLTIRKLRLLSELFLYPCVFFLAAGIFIGAIWANVSWGRYWGWDPKEVWALITFMIAALPFHGKTLTWFCNNFFFNTYILLIFVSVLMTYFGVNYFLGGMHSYAGEAEISSAIILIAAPVIAMIGIAYYRYRQLVSR